MSPLLLIGAGFSCPFGYPASDGLRIRLSSAPELVSHRDLKLQLLESGSYEDLLGPLEDSNPAAFHALTDSISRVFEELDADLCYASNQCRDWPVYPPQVGEFLGRFLFHKKAKRPPTIFTTNQDILIERLNISVTSQHYARVHHPGHVHGREMPFTSAAFERWEVTPNIETLPQLSWGSLNYIKLHGSANWLRPDGKGLMISGAGKESAIGRHPLLFAYFQLWEEAMAAEDIRLMIIGFSGRDEHIVRHIRQAAAEGRLTRLVIVDPTPAEVLRRLVGTPPDTLDYHLDDRPLPAAFPPNLSLNLTPAASRWVAALVG